MLAAIFFAAGPALSQRVPLILDQTIELPCTSNVWDVMPHPDGYYVWVQATTGPDTSHTILFSGRTDSAHYDSLILFLGNPRLITAFWRPGFTPAVTIDNRASRNTCARTIDLTDGNAITDSFVWWDGGDSGPTYQWSRTSNRVMAIYPFPLPPLVSERVSLTETSWYSAAGGTAGYHYTYWQPDAVYIHDVLQGQSSYARALGRTSFSDRAASGTSVVVGTSGHGSGWTSDPLGYHEWSETDLQFALCLADTAMVVSRTTTDVAHESPIACTINPETNTYYMFVWAANAYSIVSSASLQTFIPVAPSDTRYPLAVDIVPDNACEEFIGYESAQHAFSIYNAVSGYCYGTSDTLSTISGARIIGRYDSTFRRLVIRDSTSLKLYRFGEYLAADDHTAPIPSDLRLAAYPNPFNPSATIRFTLPRRGEAELAVYDVTGRQVSVLVDGVLTAGEHRVSFDGARLPSGIYFARLTAGGAQATQKLLLLK
jgi:hypothetical protein